MVKKKVLFIIGSPNQTSQMHQIASHLTDYDCYFTQFYTNNPIGNFLIKIGLMDRTILAGKFKRKAEEYLAKHNLQNDNKARKNKYDLVYFCTDMIVPFNLCNTKKIWVQEGMIDPMNKWTKIVKWLNLPEFMAFNTSLNGRSNKCDIYCTASEGYNACFESMDAEKRKLFATGIPNFDNAEKYLSNDFPHKNYVLVCTSDVRELGGREDRIAFIRQCVTIAKGRKLIFKLHPNEKFGRANREIKRFSPKGTLIFQPGNTNEMIANCEELITQWSSVVYVGIALGKKVHSYFNMETLYSQAPIQNNGTSAKTIAEIGRKFIEYNGPKAMFIKELRSEFKHFDKTEKELVYA
jgi:hypothetical protein